MPKYQIGNQPYYGQGTFVPPGGVVVLSSDQEPSRSWTPMDKEASAAIAKLKKQDQDREKLKRADLSKVDPDDLADLIEAAATKKSEEAVSKLRGELNALRAELGGSTSKPSGDGGKKSEGGQSGRASDTVIS